MRGISAASFWIDLKGKLREELSLVLLSFLGHDLIWALLIEGNVGEQR